MTMTTARGLAESIGGRNFAAAKRYLAENVRMRALLPGDVETSHGREAVAGQWEGWFGPAEPFQVIASSVEQVGDKFSIHFRFRLRRPGQDQETVIEQHLFITAPNGDVETIDLVCSGFRSAAAPSATAARDFEAGNLGCADGLSTEFRNRIKAIDVGDLLRVHTVDPSAKEDLPSLARLMGHVVRSVETHPDGGLTITVERGK
jgi:TusA-related sulfurtransferase